MNAFVSMSKIFLFPYIYYSIPGKNYETVTLFTFNITY